ncbi:MAG: acyl-[Lachnospiraceae bacterium]|nr:acyl-[acyl-carrier-protein] thioesterase [Lachnospiraceae bacterium]
MFEFSSRVRYSEIGFDYHMKLSAIAGRMQDCSVFHSESIGFGPDMWEQEKAGWIILSWQILVHEYPAFGEPVITRTWPHSFRGFEGDRNFTLRDESGKIFAEANSRWIYFDVEAQKPRRVPEWMKEGFSTEPRLGHFEYSPRRLPVPDGEPAVYPSFAVVPTNIDTNHHVNNLQYIDMGAGYLPEGFWTRELRVEYVRQSVLGDILTPRVWEMEEGVFVCLENEAGKTSANLQFLR